MEVQRKAIGLKNLQRKTISKLTDKLWYSLSKGRNKSSVFQRLSNSCMSRKENPQKLTQLSPRSNLRHLVGKRTAQKDVIKDITSDSQVNSYFPYRWSPTSLTINIYFYLFLYLYITRITINNGTPHLKSLKSQNKRADLGRPAIKLRSTNPRP